MMVEIIYKDKVHYRRPDNHSDVREMEKIIRLQKLFYGKTLYRIKNVPVDNANGRLNL